MISDGLPEEYFLEVESAYPGALSSQWIPSDSHLWKIENYRDFLGARKVLLADEANRRMEKLLHGDVLWLEGSAAATAVPEAIVGGITSDEEENQLEALNDWIEAKGLPCGNIAYDFADEITGQQRAVFDLAWPAGIQDELSQPVAVLLDEGNEVISPASRAGLRRFVSVPDFQRYVETEFLVQEEVA